MNTKKFPDMEYENHQQAIAGEIKAQIGFWTLAACGARSFFYLGSDENKAGGLQFDVTIEPGQKHRLIVKLEYSDTYRVELWHIRKFSAYLQESLDGVYCDMLSEVVYGMCNK